MAELFEPGGDLWGAKGTNLKFTEAQRLRAKLNAEKAEVLIGDSVEVNLDSATLTTEGSTYLLPITFVEKLKNSHREVASPSQYVLERLDGPLEEFALNWDNTTRPIYWIHVPDQDKKVSWPVYGYAADYGLGYHVTPILKEQPGWDDAEWLCRCAQCGRELPPNYFFMNTSGRLKGICKACTSTNNIVDRIFSKPQRYWSDDERQLLVVTRHWYEALWHRNLAPRGKYASHCIGEADIKARLNTAIRHRRGATPRGTSAAKIQEVLSLIAETQKV